MDARVFVRRRRRRRCAFLSFIFFLPFWAPACSSAVARALLCCLFLLLGLSQAPSAALLTAVGAPGCGGCLSSPLLAKTDAIHHPDTCKYRINLSIVSFHIFCRFTTDTLARARPLAASFIILKHTFFYACLLLLLLPNGRTAP